MTNQDTIVALEGMTDEQRKLVSLLYLKGEDSLKQAIAKVKSFQSV